ncbi:uncharacterized protein [Branchiostoma lanceolatum]|uniref:uncharacterized protein n=1 Tax=Branchiostoma lanceolatum TaxID=7740 RepID=UPI003455E3C6
MTAVQTSTARGRTSQLTTTDRVSTSSGQITSTSRRSTTSNVMSTALNPTTTIPKSTVRSTSTQAGITSTVQTGTPAPAYNTTAQPITAFPSCTFTCSIYATCVQRSSQVFQCVCNDGYVGNGRTCTLASKPYHFEVRMVKVNFTEDLNNRDSLAFRSLSYRVTTVIYNYLKQSSLADVILGVTITRFRPGSVIADYNVNVNNSAADVVNGTDISTALLTAIRNDSSNNDTLGIERSSLCLKDSENQICGQVDLELSIWIKLLVSLGAFLLAIILAVVCKGTLEESSKQREKWDTDKTEAHNYIPRISRRSSFASGYSSPDDVYVLPTGGMYIKRYFPSRPALSGYQSPQQAGSVRALYSEVFSRNVQLRWMRPRINSPLADSEGRTSTYRHFFRKSSPLSDV